MGCHAPRVGLRTVYAQRFDARGRPLDEDLMAGPVVFSEEVARRRGLEVVSDQPVPCGHCQGCLSARALDRKTRLLHEGSCWERNCVLTLTYDADHLPPGGTVVKADLSAFMMRVRNRARRHDGVSAGVRFEGIGEYGGKTARPHYHVILFNYDAPDKVHWSGKGDLAQFTSKVMDDVWGMGHVRVGVFGPKSAGYVAQYITEKVIGDRKAPKYMHVDPTGQPFWVEPEFALSSRRPGIGAAWLAKYESDVYPHGYVVLKSGCQVKPPAYYDAKYRQRHPQEFRDLAVRREVEAIDKAADNTPERLAVKEIVLKARLAQKLRDKV